MPTAPKFDRDIPCPEIRRGRPEKYFFRLMMVGESKFFPNQHTCPVTGDARAYGAAKTHGRHAGKKFAGRTVIEGGQKGVRIWRVE